jgi:hypothetical protein
MVPSGGVPTGHWKKQWSTKPLERLNQEIKRCTEVGMAVLPDRVLPASEDAKAVGYGSFELGGQNGN